MSLHTGVLLILMVTISSIQPTDYSRDANVEISSRCQKRVKRCGQFKPPKPEMGEMSCSFSARTCGFACDLICPTPEGKTALVLNQKRHGRDMYLCTAGNWKRRETPQTFCKAQWPVKEVRQNLHHVENLNGLVNKLLNTSYFYLGMASFYERADVALPGFSKLMTDLWSADQSHARDLMSYVNKRGGYITLYDIPRTPSHEVLLLKLSSRIGQAGVEMALQAAREVNEQVLELHKNATLPGDSNDPHLKHALEDGLLSSKVELIKKLADVDRRLHAFPEEDYAVGEYVLDQEQLG
ncbi:ferritin light chain, oocyte isoform isoform X2 [Aplysia californica]|nr:ferritin light chain, oocyte isoform isoform X2 [Aplysia californica]